MTIPEQLARIKKEKRMGLMTHVVAGYPSLMVTGELIVRMEEAGVDFIEIQIPFSDPAADGPVIMRANDASLQAGTTVDDCFKLARSVSKKTSIPLLFMTYYNIVFRRGVDKFCREAWDAGIKGLIVPDLPVDEESYEHLIQATHTYGLNFIPVLSPTSTDDRLALYTEYTGGFAYCTARAGTTGEGEHAEQQLARYLKRVHRHIKVPLAVGFGISKPEHLLMLKGHADIAVIGSAAITLIESKGVKSIGPYIRQFVAEMPLYKPNPETPR